MENQFGYTKLFHPNGALVSLPVPSDPAEAFSHLSKCTEVGWLITPPGIKEGEQKETVGFILRGEFGSNGTSTPYLLLYPANEALSYSFLKVYLNTASEIVDFERAAGVKLTDLPEYAGDNKPERGKSPKLDQFIVRMKRPFDVVFKANPKYSESTHAERTSKGEVYKIPRRLFVRWVSDQAPEPAQQLGNAPPQAHNGHSSNGNGKALEARQVTLKGIEQAVNGMSGALEAQNLEEWAKWAKKIPNRTVDDDEKLERTYQTNKGRLTRMPAAARR